MAAQLTIVSVGFFMYNTIKQIQNKAQGLYIHALARVICLTILAITNLVESEPIFSCLQLYFCSQKQTKIMCMKSSFLLEELLCDF